MRTFAMGEKARLADLTAATALRVEVAGTATGTDIAAFCFALDEDGQIHGDRPPVSASRPASLASAVALVSGGAAEAAFDLDLEAVAPEVHRLLFVVASVGPDIALDAGSVVLTVEGEPVVAFIMDPSEMKGQRALILGEIYRRDGWRFGAVGQGYRDGLEQLVRDYGADPAVLLSGADAKPQAEEPRAEAAVEVETADEAEAAVEPDPAPEAEADTTPVSVVEVEPEPEPEAEAEPEPGPEAAPEAAAEPEPETAAEPEALEAEPEPEPDAQLEAEAEPDSEPEAAPEPEPTPEPAPEQAAVAEAEPAPADEPEPAPAPVPGIHTFEGTGDRILRITRPVPAGPVVAEISCGGSGNFAVWTLDSSLEHDKLLVNEIGNYQGRVLLDERGTVTERLKIESDGPWTVAIQPPTAAPWLLGPVGGDGPEVLRWTGPRTVVAMTHDGSSNFMVRVYAEAPAPGQDPYLASLANTLGAYEGESILPAGPCLIEIEADGNWTVTPETS
ncbi:TerD family protein [Yinghuangia soli]|uniref:TerD family protein n=1 Tax=Yinghuangia soli TaxID=2908204 RepID=A0AA41Q354_9ACTN|nr:TerD family protein [Yinghuangia soli]MCF2530680.1 TerD family protein [Yinghuangia soli]